MVLKADQERVKLLLKDTITLLCRNGLSFKSKFCIEALIGVTLDDDDVFLININELIKTEAEKAREETEAEANEESQRNSSRHRKRKKRRLQVKTEDGEAESSGGEENSSNEDNSEAENSDDNHDDSSSHSATPAKKSNNIKQELEDDDSEDLVFVKEEPNWQQSINQNQNNSVNMSNSGFSDDQNFTSLSDMNLVPLGAQDESAMWAQTSNMQTRPYIPRGPRTSTQTSQSMSEGQQMLGQDSSQTGSKGFRCPKCQKHFTRKFHFNRHMKFHDGEYQFWCLVCGKGYMDRNALQCHVLIHSFNKPFHCDICNKRFTYKSNVKRHLFKTHNIQSSEKLQ